MYLQQRTIQQ